MLLASLAGVFDPALLGLLPSRLYGIMTNQTLMAVPLFVLMGVVLQRTRIAEELLVAVSRLLGGIRGGLAAGVVLVGTLLSATTGIVGATVVAMGLIAIPVMQRARYKHAYATGVVAATGTMGQLVPPSIALVLLADQLSAASQRAQLAQGNLRPDPLSVADMFVAVLVPSLLLAVFYLVYTLVRAQISKDTAPAMAKEDLPAVPGSAWVSLLGSVGLILAVLGSIMFGIATPTEAAAVGAFGTLLLVMVRGQMQHQLLRSAVFETASTTSMVFMILVGASLFALVFRALGGEEAVHALFSALPASKVVAVLLVLLLVFLMGFVLDFIEIIFIVVPIIVPPVLALGVDPLWLGVLIAINLQTSFLTPPFGFSLFYLRGVLPDSIATSDMYRGVLPFVLIQVIVMALVFMFPGMLFSLD